MIRWLALACLVAWAGPATAATVCRASSLGGIAFGSYDILSPTPTDSLTNIVVTCDRDGGQANVTVVVGLGTGGGSSVTARRLTLAGGGDSLGYGLFSDSGRSSVWGDSSGIDTVARALAVPNKSSASVTFTVYGRIPALQDVAAGLYTDSVQVTLSP